MRGIDGQGEATSTAVMVIAAALMTVGVVMASSTGVSLDRSLIEAGSWHGPFGRQAVFAVGACVVMLVFSRLDAGLLRWRSGRAFQPSLLVLLVSIVLLAAVWMPGVGRSSHGCRRWIDLGPVGLQPSEFAKIGLVVFLAAILSRKKESHESDRAPNALLPMVAIGLVCALVGVEDFGTAALLAAVGGVMLIVGGCRLVALAAWALPVLGAFAYLLFSHPYRVERLLAFLHIWENRLGSGYHAIQSLTAIASGGWTGRGLGAGIAQYGYLPEARTDFVFAIICEESGFVGGVAVILLFMALVHLGMRAMQMSGSRHGGFGGLFAFGVTSMIGLQALMNIAVVTVVAPTKGIALPFVSAGGSGLLCFGLAVGLLASVARRASIPRVNEACEFDPAVACSVATGSA